jgi:exodeoxyribonuclease VII large subunit
MPEQVNERKVFSLLEVTTSIQKTIADRYKSAFWVKAEMNKLNHYPHSGHCYPEMVEKANGKVIAQLRCSLWKDDFNRINHKFRTLLKEPLRDGITILFVATIGYDPVHGLTLRVLDIDPAFSLGELEREKIETIQKLQAEGIYGANKTTALPMLPKKVAVISVETSKGYADYLKIIESNPGRFKIHNFLFPSLLQGERSIASILHQLGRIRKLIRHFDCVAIVRGGGGDVGLSSFNNYQLAREVATFPIPVFTGIGHSTNETVIEMISYRNAITPTELADQLLQCFRDFSLPVERAQAIISDKAMQLLANENKGLVNTLRLFQSVTRNKMIRSHHQLNTLSTSVHQHARFRLKQETHLVRAKAGEMQEASGLLLHRMQENISSIAANLSTSSVEKITSENLRVDALEVHVRILDPINVLKRGFSITLDHAGKAIRDAAALRPGDTVTTLLAEGKLTSVITTSENKEQ